MLLLLLFIAAKTRIKLVFRVVEIEKTKTKIKKIDEEGNLQTNEATQPKKSKSEKI